MLNIIVILNPILYPEPYVFNGIEVRASSRPLYCVDFEGPKERSRCQGSVGSRVVLLENVVLTAVLKKEEYLGDDVLFVLLCVDGAVFFLLEEAGPFFPACKRAPEHLAMWFLTEQGPGVGIFAFVVCDLLLPYV